MGNFRNVAIAAVVFATGVVTGSDRADASTVICTVGNTHSYTLMTALSASPCISGNDTNTITSSFEILGHTGWILADKTDEALGDGALSLSLTGQTWSLVATPDHTFEKIMITLKQGNNFAGFLIDQLAGFTGTWGTSGPGQGTNGLSHASVYYIGKGETPNPVPLPAAAWLLLSGMGGLGFMGWRKKRAAA